MFARSPASVAALAGVLLAFQLGGGTPGSRAIEQAERSATRSLPPLPPAPSPRPDMVWVPDRWVALPGRAPSVHVPGHWERRISEQEFHVPALTVCDPGNGACTTVPAGVRGPADTRREP